MELIIFIGIQAAGKSTFYKERFSDTHVRINLDMLKTRHREKRLFELCLELKQPCVIDNTNTTRKDRHRYIPLAKKSGFTICGYYFASNLQDALERNLQRGSGAIPEKGITWAYNRLEIPDYGEGFNKLYYVKTVDNGFLVRDWESR